MLRILPTTLILLAGGLAAPAALACEAPPPHLYVDDEELVARSPRIALVQITERVSGPTGEHRVAMTEEERVRAGLSAFRAQTLEVLQGEAVAELLVYGDPVLTAADWPADFASLEEREAFAAEFNARNITDFDGHRDPRFVERGWGAARQGTDCLAHQTFVIGERYLIFEGPQHVRGYEWIREPGDLWLYRVRELIALSAVENHEENDR